MSTPNIHLEQPSGNDNVSLPIINNNMGLIDTAIGNIGNSSIKTLLDQKVTGSVANNLTTTTSGYVLDARAGKTLKGLIDDLPTKANIFDTGYESLSNCDLNQYITPGRYYCASTNAAGNITNKPTTTGFSLEVIRVNSACVLQIVYNADANAKIWFRRIQVTRGTPSIVGDWVRIQTSDSSQTYTNTDSIQLAEGDDLNNCFTPGTYICNTTAKAGSLKNRPVSVAFKMFVVNTYAGTAEWQILLPYNNPRPCYRAKYVSNNVTTITDWKCPTMETMQTLNPTT